MVIYADFETINDKAHGCEPNPQNNETDNSSWTKIKTKHKCSGYSYTVISPYFPSRTETYRGEDAGEKFLKVILEEEKSILKWMKENEKRVEPFQRGAARIPTGRSLPHLQREIHKQISPRS